MISTRIVIQVAWFAALGCGYGTETDGEDLLPKMHEYSENARH
jgi:hypothetical protein